MRARVALRSHWPEYLIEGWALGMFMISAGVFTALFEYPNSPVRQALADPTLRRALIGLAMGATAVALIYSPWGQRSGAHMNPAVTLSFLRLGKVKRWDAAFYIASQFIGGTLGVLLLAALLGKAFTHPSVDYVVTMPGKQGVAVAFVAEIAISCGMMLTVLWATSTPRLARYTGVFAGVLVATYITVEGPLSGMSMNPARTFASAAPAGEWQHLWLYFTAPVLGMLLATHLHRALSSRRVSACAKLLHPDDVRCIHCGYDPARVVRSAIVNGSTQSRAT